MYKLLLTLLLILSAVIVIAVFMQPQKIQVAMCLIVVVQKLFLNVPRHVDLKHLCSV